MKRKHYERPTTKEVFMEQLFPLLASIGNQDDYGDDDDGGWFNDGEIGSQAGYGEDSNGGWE